MDSTLESRAWRRGFAGGFLALALSVSGQVALSRGASSAGACPFSAQPGLAEQLFDSIAPSMRAQGVAQRVAVAVLGAVLHRNRCS